MQQNQTLHPYHYVSIVLVFVAIAGLAFVAVNSIRSAPTQGFSSNSSTGTFGYSSVGRSQTYTVGLAQGMNQNLLGAQIEKTVPGVGSLLNAE